MKCNLVNDEFYYDYAINLLKARGIKDVEAYLHPTSDFLQSPHDLKNIGMAAAMYMRIILDNNSRILIIVD